MPTIRVYRAIVHDGQHDEFAEFVRNRAVPLVEAQDGLISVTVGFSAG